MYMQHQRTQTSSVLLFMFFARPRTTIPILTITHNANDPFQLLRKTHFFTHDNVSYCFGMAGAGAAPTHSV